MLRASSAISAYTTRVSRITVEYSTLHELNWQMCCTTVYYRYTLDGLRAVQYTNRAGSRVLLLYITGIVTAGYCVALQYTIRARSCTAVYYSILLST